LGIETLAIGMRELERLLIVAGGIVAVVLGYRLFINLPMLDANGEGKIELPGGVSIYLSRIGPGVFFALFGIAVLTYALKPVDFSLEVSTAAAAASAPGAPQAANQKVKYSGIGASSTPDLGQREAERNRAVGTVVDLKKVEDVVEITLKGQAKDDAKAAIEDAKFRIMKSVWDEDSWGSLTEFERWRTDGPVKPPPKTIARAAALFGNPQK
jgi:hypothetical protein